MQQKPYCRQERFLAEERPALMALPEKPFKIKYYRWYTVAGNGHVFLSEDRHYYSVPYRWTDQKVQVIYTGLNEALNFILAKQVRNPQNSLFSLPVFLPGTVHRNTITVRATDC